MGQVFLGLSAGGWPVAVKVIRAELAADQEFRIRFSREVAAARRVSGLFTALVVDADVDGPVPWLATAYVTGPSLSDAVSGHGPMSARPGLALAAGLAEGLSAIHAASVVHCDLKPSNVLLSQDGPRVIDFGISRAAEAVSVTGTGLVVGSPGFMSPEQAMGEAVGPPSDVFSLGAVLVFAVTGRGPFGEGSRPELAYRLVYRQPRLGPVPPGLRPPGQGPFGGGFTPRVGLPPRLPPAEPGPGTRRTAAAGRAVPGQGSGPATHRRRTAGRGRGPAARDRLAARPGSRRVRRVPRAEPGPSGRPRPLWPVFSRSVFSRPGPDVAASFVAAAGGGRSHGRRPSGICCGQLCLVRRGPASVRCATPAESRRDPFIDGDWPGLGARRPADFAVGIGVPAGFCDLGGSPWAGSSGHHPGGGED